jgi:hypothetical protein
MYGMTIRRELRSQQKTLALGGETATDSGEQTINQNCLKMFAVSSLLATALASIEGIPLQNAADAGVNMPLCGLGTGSFSPCALGKYRKLDALFES